jgi:hypothetical protein
LFFIWLKHLLLSGAGDLSDQLAMTRMRLGLLQYATFTEQRRTERALNSGLTTTTTTTTTTAVMPTTPTPMSTPRTTLDIDDDRLRRRKSTDPSLPLPQSTPLPSVVGSGFHTHSFKPRHSRPLFSSSDRPIDAIATTTTTTIIDTNNNNNNNNNDDDDDDKREQATTRRKLVSLSSVEPFARPAPSRCSFGAHVQLARATAAPHRAFLAALSPASLPLSSAASASSSAVNTSSSSSSSSLSLSLPSTRRRRRRLSAASTLFSCAPLASLRRSVHRMLLATLHHQNDDNNDQWRLDAVESIFKYTFSLIIIPQLNASSCFFT